MPQQPKPPATKKKAGSTTKPRKIQSPKPQTPAPSRRESTERIIIAEVECRLVPLPPHPEGQRALESFAATHAPNTLRLREPDGYRLRLYGPDLIGEYCRARFGALVQEGFWTVVLDSARAPVVIAQVAQGSTSEIALSPVDVFRPVLVSGSSQFVVVHNHPSGSMMPSECDWLATDKLLELSQALSLELLDHVIVTAGAYYSMRRFDPGRWRQPTRDERVQFDAGDGRIPT